LIELADVISQLRTELHRASNAASDETLRFELGPIELEVLVAVEAAGGAEARIRFWVVEIGADAQITSTSTQRIKLTLQPSVPDEAASGTRRSTFVSGAQTSNER
jgi:hypothetical protein